LRVLGYTDNEATEKFLRSGRSQKDQCLIMGCVFWSLLHRFKMTWQPERISSEENVLADTCSRWTLKESLFWKLCCERGLAPMEAIVSDLHLIWN
jgi:hypothetical protein